MELFFYSLPQDILHFFPHAQYYKSQQMKNTGITEQNKIIPYQSGI